MKRILLIALIVLLAGTVFGQANYTQQLELLNAWEQDLWYYFTTDEEQVSGNVWFKDLQVGDTIYTDIFGTYPYMYFTATIQDTNSAADSVGIKVLFDQSNMTDTTNFVNISTLTWSNGGSFQTKMDTVGTWVCNVGASAYTGLRHNRLRIIALADNRVLNPGVSIKIQAIGHIFQN